MDKKIRSPILVSVGHVDHGKTTLLDTIRGTTVARAEPGAITQHISASFIPSEVVKKICGPLLSQLKVTLTIPGILWIDTPGHEAFTTLRKRGGAIADLAVLVIDITQGFQPQTDESLNYLKQFKTPFIVALTKTDLIHGWQPQQGATFRSSFATQSARVQDLFEEQFYRIVGQLGERGFPADRYDRVDDYTRQIAIVPVSAKTSEGIPDLLMVLAGLAQRYLTGTLTFTAGTGKGTVLEVKEYKGLGMTIDVILYDGDIRRGDYLVIGGREPVVTRIKALLEPGPLTEIRLEKRFRTIDAITAAAGVKIAAPGLEEVIAGSPLRAIRGKDGIAQARAEVEAEREEVEFQSDTDGIIIRADTLGSLEALIKTFSDFRIPIRKALIGNVVKADVMEAKNLRDKVIIAFGMRIPDDIRKLAKDNDIEIFSSDIIYRLIEGYQDYTRGEQERAEQAAFAALVHPARLRILPGYVFRQTKPAVFGVEVVKGTIKPGVRLKKGKNIIGQIKEIQSDGESRKEAVKGDKVALSVTDMVVGKDAREGDTIEVFLSYDDLDRLRTMKDRLRPDERELVDESERQEK